MRPTILRTLVVTQQDAGGHVAAPKHEGNRIRFRCLEDGHTFTEWRDPRVPLVLRQSAWCTAHDAPAVGVPDAAELDANMGT